MDAGAGAKPQEGVPQPCSPPSPSAGPAGWPGTDPRRGAAKPAGGIARAGAAPALGRVWPPPWARAGCWLGSGTTVPRRWWCSAWRWPFPTGTCGDTAAPLTPGHTPQATPPWSCGAGETALRAWWAAVKGEEQRGSPARALRGRRPCGRDVPCSPPAAPSLQIPVPRGGRVMPGWARPPPVTSSKANAVAAPEIKTQKRWCFG